jgi:hypothetical protein
MRQHLPKLLTLLVAAGISGWLFASDHERGEEHEGRESRSLPAVDNKTWRAECGSCHIPYPPAMLPERSWRKLMTGLDRHFGENASLDAAAQKEIANFLAANAADRGDSRRGSRVAASIPATQTPLRITETAWFERKHDELAAAVWKRQSIGTRANCVACHADAAKGNFDEHGVRIPRY